MVSVSNGNFEDSLGPVPLGFPSGFGNWSGDPAEVIEEDGNRILRFLETANVTGKPNGGASACNVFQLIDLSSLQQDWDTENADKPVHAGTVGPLSSGVRSDRCRTAENFRELHHSSLSGQAGFHWQGVAPGDQ
jgi:hypothetical protein